MRIAKGSKPFYAIYMHMCDRCRGRLREHTALSSIQDVTRTVCDSCRRLTLNGLDAQGAIGKRVAVPTKAMFKKLEDLRMKMGEAFLADQNGEICDRKWYGELPRDIKI